MHEGEWDELGDRARPVLQLADSLQMASAVGLIDDVALNRRRRYGYTDAPGGIYRRKTLFGDHLDRQNIRQALIHADHH